jgi:hypothetical protein
VAKDGFVQGAAGAPVLANMFGIKELDAGMRQRANQQGTTTVAEFMGNTTVTQADSPKKTASAGFG